MGRRILIVDDEAVCTMFLSLALGEEGYDVRTAHDVQEAENATKDFTPEVLITDCRLGDTKDGIDLARSLRSRFNDLGVIFVSGMPSEVIEDMAVDVPHLAIIEKPLDLSEIVESLKKTLR